MFNQAQKVFGKWSETGNPKISELLRHIPGDFFRLLDSLTLARNRKFIAKEYKEFKFPKKAAPRNIYVTPSKIGDFRTLEELIEKFPSKLCAYQPANYLVQKQQGVLFDEVQREFFLVKMMHILLAKRLESSWHSFHSTLQKITDYHESVLKKISEFKSAQRDFEIEDEPIFDEDDESFEIGKKKSTKLRDIADAGKLDEFERDLQEDILQLKVLLENLKHFTQKIQKEDGYTSDDTKLERLMGIITEKSGKNNKKLIIFTAFTDTAKYLYDELSKRGFEKLSLATAQMSQKELKDKLKGFSPISQGGKAEDDTIDTLIATDVLSEGQNLQDADMVVNYDIHWNPVRLVQRFGRIDRIGSKNEEIYGVNFWPAEDINSYLKLQSRIQKKLIAMKLGGAEMDREFTEEFQQMLDSQEIEEKQNQKSLESLCTSWDDIEESSEALGFDSFSFENFRQELFLELKEREAYYKALPKAIFSGFENDRKGLCLLLGYPAKPNYSKEHEYRSKMLLFIGDNEANIFENELEILGFLSQNKNALRSVSKDIDLGDLEMINTLKKTIIAHLEKEQKPAEIQSVMDILNGKKKAINEAKEHDISHRYDIKNLDLIAWMIVR